MLPNFHIKNFRCFEDLHLEKLGRINLLVGKNGVGKSSVLEALRIYASKASPAVLREILESRNEVWPIKDDASSVESLFREVASEPQQTILLGPDNEPLKLALFSGFEDSALPEARYYLMVESESSRQRLELDRGFAQFLLRSRRGWKLSDRAEPKAEFVPADGLTSEWVAELWDAVALSAVEDKVVESMQIILPTVESITLVGSQETSGRQPFAKLTSEDRRVPLKRLGDGVVRIFSLTLALVNARDSLLLIDEVENGIHYSVQEQLWDFMFAAARDLNVQVFATTHSLDCMTAFQRAAGKCQSEEGIVTRLERRGDKIVASQFDEADLEIVTREHIEIR